MNKHKGQGPHLSIDINLCSAPPLLSLRAVLQPQTTAAHPQGPGHVCDSQRTVLLLHVQLWSGAGGRFQATSGEQAA